MSGCHLYFLFKSKPISCFGAGVIHGRFYFLLMSCCIFWLGQLYFLYERLPSIFRASCSRCGRWGGGTWEQCQQNWRSWFHSFCFFVPRSFCFPRPNPLLLTMKFQDTKRPFCEKDNGHPFSVGFGVHFSVRWWGLKVAFWVEAAPDETCKCECMKINKYTYIAIQRDSSFYKDFSRWNPS